MGMQDKFSKRLFDSIVSFVSALGVAGDKGAYSATYAIPVVTQAEIDAAYRTSWLARKVIDIPPFDMTREWRNWQADDKQIETIEEAESTFQIVEKTRKALSWARLYGGAALILGVEGQGNADVPLDPEKVTKDALQFIHVVSRHRLGSEDMDTDPMSENYGIPKFFTVNGATTGQIRIHPSRMIRFMGNEIPDDAVMTGDGWGDSFWTSLRETITDTDLVHASIAYLTQEAKVDVISIPGLMDLLGTAETEALLLKRLSLANQQKAITNITMLDGGVDGKSGEVWNRKEMNFAGLTDILRLFLAVAAGAADIPATRLLGKSPDGMNATGDNDLRNYYDMLSSRQNLQMWPALKPLDDILLRHLFGSRDPNIYFESAPLWQLTPSEKATVSKQKADTTKVYIDMGIIPDMVMAEVIKNQLIEDEVYPGIEAAYEEFGQEPDDTNTFQSLQPDPLLLTGPDGNPLPAPPQDKTVPVADHRAALMHQHDDVSAYRLDPTNTGGIRKAWKMAVSRNLRSAEGRIKQMVKANEGVGLDKAHYREILDKTIGGHWFQKFVVRAHRQGLDDASIRLGSRVKSPFSESAVQAINASLLKTENDFSHVTHELSQQLADRVKGSTTVDEALSAVSERFKAIGVARGHTVAVVNTISSHARASLQHFRANGIKQVGVELEGVPPKKFTDAQEEMLQFTTAGDNDVCPDCEDMEGMVFSIDEAEGVIPVHPNCRCAWVPIMVGRDASPKTLFIQRKVVNVTDIIEWAKSQGFPATVPPEEMHVTVCHSRTPVDWIKMGQATGQDGRGNLIIPPGGARLVERLGPSAVVLLFTSAELSYRHEEVRRQGALFDYDYYQPHITIHNISEDSVNEGVFDFSSIQPYKGEIILGPEIFEEINDSRPSFPTRAEE